MTSNEIIKTKTSVDNFKHVLNSHIVCLIMSATVNAFADLCRGF
jgi:hypothetical protein